MTPSPKQPINEFGQPVDANNHVLKASELIQGQLLAILNAHTFVDQEAFSPALLEDLLTTLTDYIMVKISENYQKNVSLGIDIGRREAQAIIDSAKEGKKSYEGRDTII